jgi:hypothetical protein
VDTSVPLHLPPSFLTHNHRIASLMLPNTSTHHAVPGDTSPVMTRAAAPPCTAAADFLSSLGHATALSGLHESGEHAGHLGLAGDLAVGEIPPVSAASARPS